MHLFTNCMCMRLRCPNKIRFMQNRSINHKELKEDLVLLLFLFCFPNYPPSPLALVNLRPNIMKIYEAVKGMQHLIFFQDSLLLFFFLFSLFCWLSDPSPILLPSFPWMRFVSVFKTRFCSLFSKCDEAFSHVTVFGIFSCINKVHFTSAFVPNNIFIICPLDVDLSLSHTFIIPDYKNFGVSLLVFYSSFWIRLKLYRV